MTRRRRWFGLRESLADVIHCHSCGAYSKLQSGVAIMVVYYGQGLNQLELLGRKTDVANVREYMEKMGLPLPEVLASPLRGSE